MLWPCTGYAHVQKTKPAEEGRDRAFFAAVIIKIPTITIKRRWPKCPVLQRYQCAPSIIANWSTWQLRRKSWKQVFWRVSHYLAHTNNSPPWDEGGLIVEMRNEFFQGQTHIVKPVFTQDERIESFSSGAGTNLNVHDVMHNNYRVGSVGRTVYSMASTLTTT